LYIPESYFTDKNTSEAQKQFWQIKRYHFNRIIFFQQGTFYNAFDRDADLLHTEFDLLYAGGKDSKTRQTGVNGEVISGYIVIQV
jgi:DNA mismatch repair ATPase MutS